MLQYLSKSILLLLFAWSSAAFFIRWSYGRSDRSSFPSRPTAACLRGPDGKPVGSRLIAQPFTKDEYFQPRPSAPSYDASASASSTLAASNYALRDRVARALGPIVKYRSGPKAGQPVAPDIESWFQKDTLPGQPAHRGPVGEPAQLPWPRPGSRRTRHTARTWTIGRRRIRPWWPSGSRIIPALHSPRLPIWPSCSSRISPRKTPGNFLPPSPAKEPTARLKRRSNRSRKARTFSRSSFDMWRQEHPEADLAGCPRRPGHDVGFRARSSYHASECRVSARSGGLQMGGQPKTRPGRSSKRDRADIAGKRLGAMVWARRREVRQRA